MGVNFLPNRLPGEFPGYAGGPWRTHPVAWGDTLLKLAKTLDVDYDALRKANPQILNPDVIYEGDRINIPGSAEPGNSGATAGSGTNTPATRPGSGAPTTDPAQASFGPTGPSTSQSGDRTYSPYTIHSTGENGSVSIKDASEQQNHHDYQTTTRQGQQLQVRDLTLGGNGKSATEQVIPSPVAGEVVAVKPNNAGAGNMVTIKSDDGELVTIMHMSGFAVKQGQRVGYGDPLGTQGSTGNSTGPHVHIEGRPETINRWVNDLLDGKFDGVNA